MDITNNTVASMRLPYHSDAEASQSQIRNTKQDLQDATSSVHRMIRSGDLEKLNSLWQSGALPPEIWTLPNSIGWTTLHFAASSEVPLPYWSFIIRTILAMMTLKKPSACTHNDINYSCSNTSTVPTIVESCKKSHQNHSMQIVDNSGMSRERNYHVVTIGNRCTNEINPNENETTVMDSATQVSLMLERFMASSPTPPSPSVASSEKKSSSYDSSSVSPFFVTTDSGHSPVDLFFYHNLHPLQWQRPEIHGNAVQLQQAIEAILKSPSKIDSLRSRIENNRSSEHSMAESLDRKNTIEGKSFVNKKRKHHRDDVLCKKLDLVEAFWYRMELLLMACHFGTLDFANEPNLNWRVVHALAQTDCPMEVSQLALALYPHQVRERDEYGNLPLHIAAAFTRSSCFEQKHQEKSNNCGSHHTPMGYIRRRIYGTPVEQLRNAQQQHNANPCPCSNHSIMAALLKIYPEATLCPDGNGQVPLNAALKAGKTWDNGIRDLFAAGPQVVTSLTPDRPSQLHSFMLAAVSSNSSHDDLNTNERNKYVGIPYYFKSQNLQEEAYRRAKQYAFFDLGHLWTFLPQSSKDRALKDGHEYIDNMKLNTIFELLLAAPNVLSVDKKGYDN